MATTAARWTPIPGKGYIADGTVTKHRFVLKGAATGEVKLADSAGLTAPRGVARHDATDGQSVDVDFVPGMIVRVEAGAAITDGDLVTYNASGKAITATAVTEFVCGQAEEAASGDGTYLAVRLLSPSLNT